MIITAAPRLPKLAAPMSRVCQEFPGTPDLVDRDDGREGREGR
ncbi:hypothetical protein [Corynebacterium glyciniphilum]